MTTKKQLVQEIESLPDNYWNEIIDFIDYLKLKHLRSIPETMVLSEPSLVQDWDTPEEDAAWADL
ncbi:hypothetical protein FACS1894164_16850 [Spirochaetia bacterium]|nr:hypothetical protein FACS1894164_16850 [Spirochaetia bacterium]